MLFRRDDWSSTAVRRQKSIAPEFACLESKNYREVEVLKSRRTPVGKEASLGVRRSIRRLIRASSERFCIIEGTSSGSLLPIVSMMQATDARE